MKSRVLPLLLLFLAGALGHAGDRLAAHSELKEKCIARILASEFVDPGTGNLHLKLEEQSPPEMIKRLAPRWKKAQSIAVRNRVDGLFLTDGREGPEGLRLRYPAVQEARRSVSTTLSGTNDLERGNQNRAIQNWRKAEALIRRWAKKKVPLTSRRLWELNGTLGNGLRFNHARPGQMRMDDVGVSYTREGRHKFQPAHSPMDIERSLRIFESWYKDAEKALDPVQLAAEAYQRLNTIHPFADANGRSTRLVLDWILLKHGYPPATFVDEESTHVVIFPNDQLGRNPKPGQVLQIVTEGIERTLTLLGAK